MTGFQPGSELSRLPRSFYRREALEVAPELLNKVLVHAAPGQPRMAARVVEVEAYCGKDDPGSHAFRGRTARNATMFGRAGHLYVYFSYGMHHCANLVCGNEGEAAAVLLRGLAPIEGLEEMRVRRRGARTDSELCAGPGRLCQAFGIDRGFDGTDLVAGSGGLWLADDGTPPPDSPGVSGRIGLSAAADLPWRFYVPRAVGLSRRG